MSPQVLLGSTDVLAEDCREQLGGAVCGPLPGVTPSSHPLTEPARGSSSLLPLRVRGRGDPQPDGTESHVSGEPNTPSPKGGSREVTNPYAPPPSKAARSGSGLG